MGDVGICYGIKYPLEGLMFEGGWVGERTGSQVDTDYIRIPPPRRHPLMRLVQGGGDPVMRNKRADAKSPRCRRKSSGRFLIPRLKGREGGCEDQ